MKLRANQCPTPDSSEAAGPPSIGRGAHALLALIFAVLLFGPLAALSEQRFPPPDFESGHKLPETTAPAARAPIWEYVDVAVLAACLGLATWFIYKRRSRRALIGLSLFSLVYFGFWRKGCVCAIGSFQNVALGLFGTGYAIPIGVLAFFVLPLMVALFAGRAFCAGVCPHGALQDAVLLKPIKVPGWLEQGLNVLPFVYLGAGVLFAVTGSAFIVCQYDPFVPIFRMNGRTAMVVAGIALLVLGMFVGRPYCRFLCPYGALLKITSVVAKFRVRVTPDYCTQCRLCEASCPFGAMREPEAPKMDSAALAPGRRRLAITVALLPVLVLAGVWLGARFAGPASRMHPTVKLAEELVRNQGKSVAIGSLTPDQRALERARNSPREILEQAVSIRKQFNLGSKIFGGWVGLVIALKLVSLCLIRQRTDYEPDRGDCFACARCFEYCPNELVRRGVVPVLSAASAPGCQTRTAGVPGRTVSPVGKPKEVSA